jgi:AcrR family transcriptional regulator
MTTSPSSPPPEIHDSNETRMRLLDTAAALFAEHGFNGISLRAITAKANVNLAAINYHFRNKEGLFRAIFQRFVEPMNAERRRLLDLCIKQEEKDGKLDIGAVLEAFIGPAIRVSSAPEADVFRKLSGRAFTDPSPAVKSVVYELYDLEAQRFVDILARACPHLTREDLFWRLACIYGAMMYVRADTGRLQMLVGGFDMTNSGSAMHHLIPFLTEGLKFPSLTTPKRSKR